MKTDSPRRPAISPAQCLALLLFAMVTCGSVACRKSADTEKTDLGKSGTPGKSQGNSRHRKEEPVEFGRCRVYTGEPGFLVFVDGEPARDKSGQLVRTPCAVLVRKGSRDITVARPGLRDRTRYIEVGEDTEVVFESPMKAEAGAKSIADADFLTAATARPIPLIAVNSRYGAGGKLLDPYITPDGLTLYFVSTSGRKGVHFVSRKSPYDYFSGKPEVIKGTQGYDLPSAPCLSADSLSIVYTNLQTGNVYHVFREEAVGSFGEPLSLYERDRPSKWVAAQVVRDGNRAWYLYCLKKVDGQTRGFVAKATRRQSDLAGGSKVLSPLSKQKFGQPASFSLRGFPPCISQDGMRQYFFDGRELKRATRNSFDEPFSEPALLATLNVDGFAPEPGRRSYSITDDEQWLFYESRGQLNMIRVFAKPRKELAIIGTPIAPRPVKVAKVPDRKPMPKDIGPVKPKVDPRTLPLPYPPVRKQLVALLGRRKYAEARQLLQKAMKDPQLQKDRNLLEWDAQDVERTAAFWDDVKKAYGMLKPGETFSIGSSRVQFTGLEKGEIVASSLGKPIRKKLIEMRLTDIVSQVDKTLGRTDPKLQLRVGCFWFYDAQGNPKSALTRLQKAGDDGAEFAERLAQRRIQQAEHEMARDNIVQALEIADEVRKAHPGSKAAQSGQGLIDRAYARTKWQPVGGRTWKIENGVYTAGAENSPGSLLRSPQEYENFELRLEWRSDVPQGKGGVYFRYNGGDLSESAFKIELADDYGSLDKVCTGALYKIEAPKENAVKPQGQWNTLILRVRKDMVVAVINGREVLNTKAESKTIPLKGYVALDGGLGGISYRKTLLLELP